MAQPPGYSPATDFSAEEANNLAGRSTVRTAPLDAEFAAIDVTLDALLANLAVIQRDDLELMDGKVKLHTLAADVKTLLATTGCVVRGAWLTATIYNAKDIVSNGGITYIAASQHTSGTFATDLAAGKWLQLSSTLATDVAFTPQAGIAASTVSAALAEIGNQIGDGTGGMGFRNRLINGDFRIDQRYNGAASSGASGSYAADRWQQASSGGGTFNQQQLTTSPPPGFRFYNRLTVTAADASIAGADFYQWRQYIEGLNVDDLDFGFATAKTITLSFWVRSSLTGTFGLALQNGANNRSSPASFTINAANTWEYKTITFAGDTTGTWLKDTGVGLFVIFDIGSGSTYKTGVAGFQAGNFFGPTGTTNFIATAAATMDFTGMQLEAGSVATPFERRSHGTELALCQRYYEQFSVPVLWWANLASTAIYFPMQFKVEKRANPTITLPSSTNVVYNNVGAAATPDSFSTTGVNTWGMSLRADRAAGVSGFIGTGTIQASAEAV